MFRFEISAKMKRCQITQICFKMFSSVVYTALPVCVHSRDFFHFNIFSVTFLQLFTQFICKRSLVCFFFLLGFPMKELYHFPGQASALCGVWIVCCSQSITACSIYRILVPFGEVSIMMSLALYSARLRLMASSSNRSSNTCFKCVSKCFDALGHANAVKFVPLVVYTIQLVIVLLLFHWIPETNNVKLARGLSNGEEGFYQGWMSYL